MVHPLVEQLRFTRSEWLRGLKDVTAEEAARRFEPINPIAWMVGHLAWQEQVLLLPFLAFHVNSQIARQSFFLLNFFPMLVMQ